MGQNHNSLSRGRQSWGTFRQVHDTVAARLNSELNAACSIGLSDYEILSSLAASDNRQLRMTELATASGLSPSGLTRRFDALISQGLVSRAACEDDRRGVIAELTKDGARVAKAASPVFERAAADCFFGVLGEKSTRTLDSAMEKVIAANS